MAKITAPNRKRFLQAKHHRQAKVAKLRAAYLQASGAHKEEILTKVLRVNKYLSRQDFLKTTGK